MENKKKWPTVDGFHVIEEFLLTKGEQIVDVKNMTIPFKPLIDFALIVYSLKINSTNRFAMKFDLEKFFMRRCAGEIIDGWDMRKVKVPTEIFDKVKLVNNEFRAVGEKI